MITRDRALIKRGVTPELLAAVLAEHGRRVREMEVLRAYYDGRHAILQRTKTAGASNNRLVINHARYIVELASAYLIGSPVGYADDAQAGALQALSEAYRRCDADSVDAELAKHAGIYGRAAELLYMDACARPRTAAIDPRFAFVVYDDTVAHAPLLGVHRTPRADGRGKPEGAALTAYTADKATRFILREGAETPEPVAEEPHYFGGVPVVEYWNNEDERGDFEPVVTLIDAYNLLMSDRVNDKEQLVDALLMLSGVTLGDTDDEFCRAVQRLRDQRILEMPSVGAAAGYLTKQLNETEIQVLADALVRDIHKIAMVPAMTDEHFAGQASGVAMRFKLLGLEQLTKAKERWFREGLRSRMRLFANVLAALGSPKLDADAVEMTFTRGLPLNGLEQARMVRLLRGLVPDEILLKQIAFIDDVDKALEMTRRQQGPEASKATALEPYV